VKKILGIIVTLVLLVTFVNQFLSIRNTLVSQTAGTSETQVSDDAAQESSDTESVEGTATDTAADTSAEPEPLSDDTTQQESAQETQATEQTAAQTAAQTTTQASTQTAETAVTHSYMVVKADVTWEEAAAAAKASGGYLAVITSQEEFDKVAALADQSSTLYLWLGAESDTYGNFYWKNGESFTYAKWYPGEPSGSDEDGTPENYLCMWKVNGSWSWNDQRNDLISGYSLAAGKIGYVIEYDN
jgi:hypothetical protein